MIAAFQGLHTRQRQRQRLAARLAALPGTPNARSDAAPSAVPHVALILPHGLQVQLVRAGIDADRRILLKLAALWILAVSLGFTLGGSPLAALALVAVPAGLALAVQWRAARHMQALANGLPFLIDAMLQLLRVGNSLQQALVKSAKDAGPEVRRFIMPAIGRIAHGAPPADALGWAAARIAAPELQMLAAAVRINARHGGSMAATLANLARLLRHGIQVRRDLRAASAEVRFSGIVLMAMPVAIALIMAVLNPAYARFFLYTGTGHRLALIGLALQLAGMAVMRRLMQLPF